MSAFDKLIDRVLSHEGGYVNLAADPGGETKFGVSKRSYPHLDIKALTREAAVEIYRRDFWDRVQGDKLHPAVAFQALDAAINHGIGNSVRWLQRAAGVADDGVIGPMTLTALGRREPSDLVLLFNAERLDFYTKLSTWESFGRGWCRRVAGNLRFGAQDA